MHSSQFSKPTSLSEKIILLGGSILFLLLGILSLVFWKERQAYDAAHYLLELIIRKNFFIAHQRPAGIVSQVLPLIGIYLKLPLAWLMKLYSVGDILFYFLVFLWLALSANNYPAALTLLMSYLLTVGYSFYCPVTELLQGMALLPVVWVLANRNFRFKLPVLFCLMAFIIFSHPLLFIPVGVMIGWWWNQQKENSQLARFLLAGFVVITGLKLMLLDTYDYQKTYYPVVFKDYSNLHNATDVHFIVFFLKLLLKHFPVPALLALLTGSMLLLRKVYLQAVYFAATLIGFLLIIICTHRFEYIGNYSERMLLPLSFLIALPFTREVWLLKSDWVKQLLLLGLMVFFLFRTNEIRKLSTDYTIRIAQMQDLIYTSRALGHQKTIAEEEFLEQVPTANTGWCYSIETMLYSALDGPDKTVSVAMQQDHINRIKEAGVVLQPNQWIKWAEYVLTDDTLPARYFLFKPEVYSTLRSEGVADEKVLHAVKCSLLPPVLHSKKDSVIINVQFTGLGNAVIPARSSVIRMRYRMQEILIPPATDLVENGKQQICISTEIEKPEEIVVDMIPAVK